jgi:hypothetical protein
MFTIAGGIILAVLFFALLPTLLELAGWALLAAIVAIVGGGLIYGLITDPGPFVVFGLAVAAFIAVGIFGVHHRATVERVGVAIGGSFAFVFLGLALFPVGMLLWLALLAAGRVLGLELGARDRTP